MKPQHYLLIIFVAPPLIALALGIFMIAASFHHEPADPRSTGTIGVKKGGRIGNPGYTLPPPQPGGDFQ
ncbi:hypothetical protein [Rhizobiales bacterium]|jgi:hypothetical protein|uniref:hypothetical protein n=1 Tax=unclassified Rhizobium TaxID=2613769 RepID=UPI000DE0FBC0